MSLMMASSAAEDLRDVAGIFELLGVERADAAVGEQLREADDVGERRAQFVGDVIDEIVAQLLRATSAWLRSVSARSTLALAVTSRKVMQRRAVRQRQRRAVENQPVGALDARRQTLARCSGRPTIAARRSSHSSGSPHERQQARAISSICGRSRGACRVEAPQRGEGRD